MSKYIDTHFLNLKYYFHLLPLNEQLIKIKKLKRYAEKYPQQYEFHVYNKYSLIK